MVSSWSVIASDTWPDKYGPLTNQTMFKAVAIYFDSTNAGGFLFHPCYGVSMEVEKKQDNGTEQYLLAAHIIQS